MNQTTESLIFPVPLSFEAHSLAKQQRGEHNQPQKCKQVYLNTLAIYAVDFYCQCMGFETDWATSDSHNPLMRKFMDVADLNVKQLGKLECRPVLPDAEVLEVPSEAWENRIGYIAVRLNPSLKQAILLGFVPSVAHQEGIIPLGELRSLADLPAYLSEFLLVNLRNWLEGIYQKGWQSIDEEFVTKELKLAPAFRSRTLRFRGKKSKQELIEILQTTQDEETRWQAAECLWEIDPNHPASGAKRAADLGMKLGNHAIALMVAILPKPDHTMAILLRVYPMDNQQHLPPKLQLIGLDEAGNSFCEVQSREKDNYIQFKFTADPSDRFTVKLALDDASITESFIV